MSSFNTKNYNTDNGDKTVIGGVLEFEDGAQVENFPGAANVADTTGNAQANAGVIKAMLVALKDAGLMVGDAWSLSFKTSTGASLHDMPTTNTLANSNDVTSVVLADGVITVTLDKKVSTLKDCDHGATWGTHKWLGFGITTGLGASVAGVVFADDGGAVTLTAADDAEASDLGLSTGDFILYIKAENVLANGGAEFTLGGLGKQKTAYTIKIAEPTS